MKSIIMTDGKRVREEVCEQRWADEVSSKKTLDLYAAVKGEWKKEKYLDNPGDRRGGRLKFKFRTRLAGLRAEVGGWKNRNQSSQCIYVLYRRGRECGAFSCFVCCECPLTPNDIDSP